MRVKLLLRKPGSPVNHHSSRVVYITRAELKLLVAATKRGHGISHPPRPGVITSICVDDTAGAN